MVIHDNTNRSWWPLVHIWRMIPVSSSFIHVYNSVAVSSLTAEVDGDFKM